MLPSPTNVLLQNCRVYTKLDLHNAYHLVRIGNEWKMAFNTTCGHYEYLVMPFGLINAPAVFQAFVNDVLHGKSIYVYRDEILVFSPSLENHVKHICQVLQRLLENGQLVKAEKCEFHKSSAHFLGFVVGEGRLQMEAEKVPAVRDWPVPSPCKELQHILGFANFYCRFDQNFSSVTVPLTALTSSKIPFKWSPGAQPAFDDLKRRFTTAPILILPDPNNQFIVEVDTSDSGIGGALFQGGKDNKIQTCAFFSKYLSPAERNYSVGDRKLLAIKLALEE